MSVLIYWNDRLQNTKSKNAKFHLHYFKMLRTPHFLCNKGIIHLPLKFLVFCTRVNNKNSAPQCKEWLNNYIIIINQVSHQRLMSKIWIKDQEKPNWRRGGFKLFLTEEKVLSTHLSENTLRLVSTLLTPSLHQPLKEWSILMLHWSLTPPENY